MGLQQTFNPNRYSDFDNACHPGISITNEDPNAHDDIDTRNRQ